MPQSIPFVPYGETELYRTNATDQRYRYGTMLWTQDGRLAYFAENGGTQIVAGRLVQSEVPGANFDDIVIAAAAGVGALAISITNQATAIGLNDFAGGYMVVQDDAGEGHVYVIRAHAAIAASAAGTINLDPPGIRVALTTATTVLLVKHHLKDVIIHPSPPTALVVGVTPTTFAVDNFGWLQYAGMASVLGDVYTGSPLAIGRPCYPSSNVDGAIGIGRLTWRTGSTAAADSTSGALVEDATGAEIAGFRQMAGAIDTNYSPGAMFDPEVGWIAELAVDTEESMVFLRMS